MIGSSRISESGSAAADSAGGSTGSFLRDFFQTESGFELRGAFSAPLFRVPLDELALEFVVTNGCD